MKKYLLIFLYSFIVFSSFANSQQDSLPVENITVAEWERQTGKTAADFIELLKDSDHPRASIWIDELLNRNDPAIDHQLVQLLAQEHWLEPPHQEDVLRWMAILIRREFADNKDVIEMFEEEPWKSHFVSDIAKETHAKIVRQKTMSKEKYLRLAVGYILPHFLILGLNNNWDLASNPRLFTWTTTILTIRPLGFEQNVVDALHAVEDEKKANWQNFDDLDQLTKLLLTQSTATLESRLRLVTQLPRTRHPQMLNWILTAIKEKARTLQQYPYSYNSFIVSPLNLLLKDHLSGGTFLQPTNNPPNLSEKDIETALLAVDLLLNILARQPSNDPHSSRFPVYDDHLADILTILAKEVGFDDPRIHHRVGQILARNHLPFPKVLQLLQSPGWRDHSNALFLLVGVIQNLHHRPLASLASETKEIEKLLLHEFWQNHPQLKGQLGRRLEFGPERPVTLRNVSKYCPAALTPPKQDNT